MLVLVLAVVVVLVAQLGAQLIRLHRVRIVVLVTSLCA